MLRPASRNRWLVISRSPSMVIRRRVFRQQPLTDRLRQTRTLATGQRSNALVFTLLTFCPPGPPLRAKVNSNSRRGI